MRRLRREYAKSIQFMARIVIAGFALSETVDLINASYAIDLLLVCALWVGLGASIGYARECDCEKEYDKEKAKKVHDISD